MRRALRQARLEAADGPGDGLHQRFGLLVLLALIALLAGAVIVGRVALGGGPRSGPGTQTAFAGISGPAAPAVAGPLPQRIVIPAIGVDAPVAVKGVDQNGVMESPDGPREVAWYGFSGSPGSGGSAIFSGHLDYRGAGPAVFARLEDLDAGDVIEVRLADGTAYRYEVSGKDVVRADGPQAGAGVGTMGSDTVTLITDAGNWDGDTGQFDQRLVVRARRIE